MKHIATVAALLALAAGTASAQSSVTLFGVVDANLRNVDNSGVGSNTSMTSGGLNSSRFGFRGVEDLGGGLKAGFWLESDIASDTGMTSVDGRLFSRRSTVSLMGNFGEVRLGRDYNPTGLDTFSGDPFFAVGVGGATGSSGVARFSYGPLAQANYYRSDNLISYFTPNIAGFYGSVGFSLDEGVNLSNLPAGNQARKYAGGRLGYANGPIDATVSYGATDVDITGGKYKTTSIGGSYDFGVAKLMGRYFRDELVAVGKENRILLGVTVPVGAHLIRASYNRSDATGGTDAYNASDATKLALGYVHNLSKRTALYGTLARISNKGGATFAIAGGNSGMAAGGKSTGYEMGLKHSF
ncbi:MAG: porin [Polaromonas sp.]|nr:porin [Polaromonas sp.]